MTLASIATPSRHEAYRNPHLVEILTSYLSEVRNALASPTILLGELGEDTEASATALTGVLERPFEELVAPLLHHLLTIQHGQVIWDSSIALYPIPVFESCGHFLLVDHSNSVAPQQDSRYVLTIACRTSALLEYFYITHNLHNLLDTIHSARLVDIYAQVMHDAQGAVQVAAFLLRRALAASDAGDVGELQRLGREIADRLDDAGTNLGVFRHERQFSYRFIPVDAVLEELLRGEGQWMIHRGIRVSGNLSPAVAGRRISAVLIPVLKTIMQNSADSLQETIRAGMNRSRLGEICLSFLPHEAKNFIVARVKDNGRGIADAVRARLFSPFVSTKGRGKGMGLYLARRILQSAGGSISLVASSVECGTEFELLIPARQATDND